jgi:hypothetical protein
MSDAHRRLVFERPKPAGDRIAFGLAAAVSLGLALFSLLVELHEHGVQGMLDEAVLIGFLLLAGTGMAAVAWIGGTSIVVIDRNARTVDHRIARGPLPAINNGHPFRDIGAPVILFDPATRRFLVELPVKDRINIQIDAYLSETEAEAVRGQISAALALPS